MEKYFNGDESAIHSNLLIAGFVAIATFTRDPKHDFKRIVSRLSSPSSDTKNAALRSLGAINDLSLFYDFLVNSLKDPQFKKNRDRKSVV